MSITWVRQHCRILNGMKISINSSNLNEKEKQQVHEIYSAFKHYESCKRVGELESALRVILKAEPSKQVLSIISEFLLYFHNGQIYELSKRLKISN